MQIRHISSDQPATHIPVAQIFGLLLSCQWWAENLRIPRTVGKTHTPTAKKKKETGSTYIS
jgi:hypothetical protein